MRYLLLRPAWIELFDFRRQFPVTFLVFGHEQTPDACKKTRYAFHATHAPGFHLFQGSHKHLVATKGVSAVLVDHVVRVHDVAARFRHFLVVFAEDNSLINQSLERLWLRDVAEIEQDFVPETRVKQMQDRMLGAADVQIDATWLLAGHPITLRLFAYETSIVVRIAESQVVPA